MTGSQSRTEAKGCSNSRKSSSYSKILLLQVLGEKRPVFHSKSQHSMLADPRLRDLLVTRVLPELNAAALGRLRETCSFLKALLDDDTTSSSCLAATCPLVPKETRGLQQQQRQPGLCEEDYGHEC